MERLFRGARRGLQRRPLALRTELILIFVGAIAVMSALSLVVMQVTARGADELIYEQSAEILSLTTRFVDGELKQVDDLTYSIATDLQIQDALERLDAPVQPYERRQIAERIEGLLLPYALKLPGVASVHLLDLRLAAYSAGREDVILPASVRESLSQALRSTNGVNVFIVPAWSKSELISGRLVRKIQGLSLAPIGYLILRLDVHMFFDPYLSLLPKGAMKLAVIAPEGVIFSNVGPLDVKRIEGQQGKRFSFLTIGGQRYFAVLKRSSYTGWLFLNMLDYTGIERRTLALRLLVGGAILLLSAACALTALGFARKITRPLEELTAHLRVVEGGSFLPADESKLDASTNSEIRVFYRNFNMMIERIDSLIEDNYRKKMQLLDSDFRMLQAQINPHFLYNTLDSINWIARMNKQESISVMVKALSNLFRRSISQTDGVVSLAEELEVTESYITIQRVRFGERLDYAESIDEGVHGIKLPRLTLQPIVENAILHGLEQKAGRCRIRVRAVRSAGLAEIEVSDDGPGMSEEVRQRVAAGGGAPAGRGIGLQNIRDRLRIFFGEQARLEIASRQGEGTSVLLLIPWPSGEDARRG